MSLLSLDSSFQNPCQNRYRLLFLLFPLSSKSRHGSLVNVTSSIHSSPKSNVISFRLDFLNSLSEILSSQLQAPNLLKNHLIIETILPQRKLHLQKPHKNIPIKIISLLFLSQSVPFPEMTQILNSNEAMSKPNHSLVLSKSQTFLVHPRIELLQKIQR